MAGTEWSWWCWSIMCQAWLCQRAGVEGAVGANFFPWGRLLPISTRAPSSQPGYLSSLTFIYIFSRSQTSTIIAALHYLGPTTTQDFKQQFRNSSSQLKIAPAVQGRPRTVESRFVLFCFHDLPIISSVGWSPPPDQNDGAFPVDGSLRDSMPTQHLPKSPSDSR